MKELLDIVARLRGPGGCPWDQKQTHLSLIPFLLEETWEVIEEIQSERYAQGLKEELGDLLFQVVLHAQLAKEAGHFTFEEVVAEVSQKMIFRHPHVFGDASPTQSQEELKEQWNRLKHKDPKKSVMEGIPHQGPQLLHAKKLGERAANLGFEFEKIEQIVDKIHEETQEVCAEIASGDQDKLEAEIGDLLFAVTNLARFAKINPELALKRTNEKFKNRFLVVEQAILQAQSQGRKLSLAEMEESWNQAKAQE